MKTAVEALLTHIRDNYELIRQQTESLDKDSPSENCLKVAVYRAGLLKEIENDRKQLDTICKCWQERCGIWGTAAALQDEIQHLILTILSLDSMIHDYITRKLENVKSELSSLDRNSKVALSYARHSI